METHLSTEIVETDSCATYSVVSQQNLCGSSPILTTMTGSYESGSSPISQKMRDSVETLDRSSLSLHMQALGSHSLVASPSIPNGYSPISPKMASSAKTLDGSSPSSQIETLVDRSLVLLSPNPNGSLPFSPIVALGNPPLVSLDGSSSSLCSPKETEENNQTFSPSSSNLNGSSISSSDIETLDKNNPFVTSVPNSNGSSPSSSMETLEDHSVAPRSSCGTGSPSSPMETTNDSQALASCLFQPISVIMPEHSGSLDDKLYSPPKNESYSFSPYDRDDNPQEEHNPSTYMGRCQRRSFRSMYDGDCWCEHCETRWGSQWSSWSEAEASKEIKPTGVGAGLSNLGNTCFINSVLQCFTHTVPLVQALRTYDHPMPRNCNRERFCVICTLRDHIDLSLSFSGGVVSPSELVNNLNYFSSFFRKYRQEDAHEFLQSLLDKLEKCCLDSKKKDESLSSQDINIVERVFGGRLISRLGCCNCSHYSDTYEPLVGLSLEIEEVDTLQSALESFTSVEKLEDPETKFICDNCKETVSKEKQLMVDQAPSVAAFHLKRFKNDGTSVEKILKHVEFPLELDLQPYTISRQSNNVELKYHLYAFVEHIGGSLTSGHYFCYIRSSPDTWHRLDDSQVTRVEEDCVLSQDAYILFYARQDTPWFSSIFEVKKPCSEMNISNSSPQSVLDTVDSCCTSDHRVENINNCDTNEFRNVEKTLSVSLCGTRDDFIEVDKNRVSSKGTHKLELSLSEFGESKDDTPITDASVLPRVDDFEESCAMPALEDNNCYQGIGKVSWNNGSPLTLARSQSPNSSRGHQGEGSYRIPRDHLKSEKRGTRKRPLSNVPEDLNRSLALKFLKKHMPGSRAMVLSAAMGVQHDGYLNKRKKKVSSPCKKASPRADHRPNHEPVMRPVAILR